MAYFTASQVVSGIRTTPSWTRHRDGNGSESLTRKHTRAPSYILENRDTLEYTSEHRPTHTHVLHKLLVVSISQIQDILI